MPKVAVMNVEGKKVGDIELSETVFGIEPNKSVLYDAIIMQRASLRRGTHSVKNRSAVRGGGRKPWRQKGTGRARQGTIRAPQWRGGGVVFGPTPRSYSYKLPKKVRRLALKSALSLKVIKEEIIVIDQFNIEQPKTKAVVEMLKNLNVNQKTLIVGGAQDLNIFMSARNIPGVKYVEATGINVLDLVGHDRLIITKDAVSKVEEVFA